MKQAIDSGNSKSGMYARWMRSLADRELPKLYARKKYSNKELERLREEFSPILAARILASKCKKVMANTDQSFKFRLAGLLASDNRTGQLIGELVCNQ